MSELVILNYSYQDLNLFKMQLLDDLAICLTSHIVNTTLLIMALKSSMRTARLHDGIEFMTCRTVLQNQFFSLPSAASVSVYARITVILTCQACIQTVIILSSIGSHDMTEFPEFELVIKYYTYKHTSHPFYCSHYETTAEPV